MINVCLNQYDLAKRLQGSILLFRKWRFFYFLKGVTIKEQHLPRHEGGPSI